MELDPTLADEATLAETRRRAHSAPARADLITELALGGLFVLAAVALWWIAPPHRIAWVQGAACLLALVLAMRVQFETSFGFTVATELAFVPLVLTVPAALVAPAVLLAFTCARVPEMATGKLNWGKLPQGLSNSCFALGPALVFALGGSARHAGPLLLIGALAAQFATDFGASALYHRLARGASIRSQLAETWWVWVIDAALATVGLAIAGEMDRFWPAVFAVLPLLGLLTMFARERSGRLEGVLELSETYRGTALLLGDVVEADDTYTGQHSQGVVELALIVGRALGLAPGPLRNLEFAALLHDVGKITIPKAILNKPGKLDAQEWAIMQTHAVEGQRMLSRIGGFMEEVGAIVRSHHERWDGGGYPDGLLAEAAPLEARIITCCDSWSAMCTDRPYRRALPHETAIREMRDGAGTQFDPRVVRALLAVVAELPSVTGVPGLGGHVERGVAGEEPDRLEPERDRV